MTLLPNLRAAYWLLTFTGLFCMFKFHLTFIVSEDLAQHYAILHSIFVCRNDKNLTLDELAENSLRVESPTVDNSSSNFHIILLRSYVNIDHIVYKKLYVILKLSVIHNSQ